MNVQSASLETAVPSTFDLARHNDTENIVKSKKGLFPASWEQFNPAWRAVLFRLIWTTEHHETFTESIMRAGSAPPWPDRYIQDRESFAFFVSAVSTIEVACYAIYAVCSIASPAFFPIAFPGDLRRINPHTTHERLNKAFPGEALSQVVDTVTTHAVFADCKRIRNSLIHQVAPSRTIHASVGAPPPEEGDLWNYPTFSLSLAPETTSERQQWIADAVNKLEEGLFNFVKSRLN